MVTLNRTADARRLGNVGMLVRLPCKQIEFLIRINDQRLYATTVLSIFYYHLLVAN